MRYSSRIVNGYFATSRFAPRSRFRDSAVAIAICRCLDSRACRGARRAEVECMLVRTLFAAVVIINTVGEARAEVHVGIGGGFGIAAYDPCLYPDAKCEDPAHRAFGASPLVTFGVRDRSAISETWWLRYGGSASAPLIPAQPAGPSSSGSVMTGSGEIGVEHGLWSLDMTFGVSR